MLKESPNGDDLDRRIVSLTAQKAGKNVNSKAQVIRHANVHVAIISKNMCESAGFCCQVPANPALSG